MGFETINAPWNHEQQLAIRAYQGNPRVHPYTCPGCGSPLSVGRFWMECPHRNEPNQTDCGGRQTWVYAESINRVL